MEAKGYPHTSRMEEDSISECFVSVLVVLERHCIDEVYYLGLFGDYSGYAVPLEVLWRCLLVIDYHSRWQSPQVCRTS